MVLFSSTSALFGSPGQGNYAAANAVLDALAPAWTARGAYRARSVQWGPWSEAGMAVEKNTLQRLKASGMGGLSNAQGMAILGSVLCGDAGLVGAAHIKWGKLLRAAYDETPRFLEEMEAEAKKAAPQDEGGAGGLALATLSPQERLVAIQETIHRLAREVVDGDDLALDAPLLESGMDSLSGVEFKNRLQTELGGLRIPNSAVFDYPTILELASFVDTQFEGVAGQAAAAPAAITNGAVGTSASAAQDQFLELLNERTAGTPLFLVPGAGMQSGSFRALASVLPVPTYGFSWPRGALPRESWPETLEGLAATVFQEVQKVQPSGPYFFAGHSFGAAVCLELARLAEARGEQVAIATLLDPRTLPPVRADLGPTFEDSTLASTLALLSESTEGDGARYAGLLSELSSVEEGEQQLNIVRGHLGEATTAMLLHVHETVRWYASLLAGETKIMEAEKDSRKPLQAKIVALAAQETWKQSSTTAEAEDEAQAKVKKIQQTIFQEDAEIAERVAQWCGEAATARVTRVQTGHFAMLQEPHVTTTALQLCHAIVEGQAT